MIACCSVLGTVYGPVESRSSPIHLLCSVLQPAVAIVDSLSMLHAVVISVYLKTTSSKTSISTSHTLRHTSYFFLFVTTSTNINIIV